MKIWPISNGMGLRPHGPSVFRSSAINLLRYTVKILLMKPWRGSGVEISFLSYLFPKLLAGKKCLLLCSGWVDGWMDKWMDGWMGN